MSRTWIIRGAIAITIGVFLIVMFRVPGNPRLEAKVMRRLRQEAKVNAQKDKERRTGAPVTEAFWFDCEHATDCRPYLSQCQWTAVNGHWLAAAMKSADAAPVPGCKKALRDHVPTTYCLAKKCRIRR